jgi:hypothetical protein
MYPGDPHRDVSPISIPESFPEIKPNKTPSQINIMEPYDQFLLHYVGKFLQQASFQNFKN